MFGFLNLNKPAGWTSHDCVAKVRRLYQQKRVGHGGTLDPAATGVLPIAVGKATRLLQYLPTFKQYQAQIRFGVQTTTDDLEGEVLTTQTAAHITLEAIAALLPQFVGQIEQVPPAHSAIQRDGKRLYELARAGVAVDVPPRQVEVTDIRIVGWQAGAQPELTVEIDCGPGTYIRAIARDLGAALGVGGTLARLMRTQSCGLSLTTSCTFADLQTQQELSLVPPEHLLTHLTRIELDFATAQRWCQGQKLNPTLANLPPPCLMGDYLQVYQAAGPFLGIGHCPSPQEFRPKTVISQPEPHPS